MRRGSRHQGELEMKLTIDRAGLVRITAAAADVAPAKNPMPILGSVLLTTKATTDGHRLEAVATDLYVSSRMHAACDTETPGTVAVNAKALKDLAARMPEGSVKLWIDGTQLIVKSGRSRYKLPTSMASDMPPVPSAPDGMVQVSGATLLRRLSAVGPAMSTDESRPHIACVMLDDTVAVGTDGHRLHKVEGGALCFSAMLPPKGVSLLTKLAKAGDLEVGVGSDRLFARQGDHVITTQLVDDVFPPYAKVIPAPDAATAVYQVPRQPLTDALKRLGYVSDGVRFRAVAGAVELACEDVDTGVGSESVDCDATEETPWIGINAKYLLAALTAAGGDEVTVRTAEPLDPVVVTGDGFVGVTMPMRI